MQNRSFKLLFRRRERKEGVQDRNQSTFINHTDNKIKEQK